jgi:hypothetical protein
MRDFLDMTVSLFFLVGHATSRLFCFKWVSLPRGLCAARWRREEQAPRSPRAHWVAAHQVLYYFFFLLLLLFLFSASFLKVFKLQFLKNPNI